MRIWLLMAVGGVLLLSLNQTHALNNSNILVNFSQLVQAIENGDNVRAIIHFDNCLVKESASQTQKERRLEGATTRFNFTHFFHAQEKINDQLIDTVTTSMKIFIERPSGELLTFSGRLSVFEDNTATLHLDFFNPILHKHQLVLDWLCTISNGEDDNGLVLFNFF
ncbi:hypothetical protein [Legionella longbeachae]|uniref:VirK protein n=1 Tax=Legionella longbeachae serogroup 1 (strain NSW150) TaxID=661367 RepID=D3HMT5_LEGLN|nr:hypothetical protein [Legionella longbeachae]VEE04286.1 Uncharacterised protein [Legionella oakridgensis]HBD7397056.1 hypothetical protein [Legionella pneumophila]ARB92887.1 hypothetical protein A6J40_12185 [Legionella longbeachae]ARM33972.1 hypothetical protein B0B39_10735 [Legionella longbeachae]EEZ96821.1 conserved hypothetical protein [Legionella longbeachae D-4968]